MSLISGYTCKLLRVDLSTGDINTEVLSHDILRKYLGGAGLGARFLFDEVQPGVKWFDPENRFIIATGPLNGTTFGGSGCSSVVTKAPLTEGAVHAEANGFMGAFLKFCGFDMVIIQGAAPKLSYLYIKDGEAEIKDASHLSQKDSLETESLIKQTLGTGEHQSSVFAIGPAGENKVRFACLVGDRGHVAAHNGLGAVLGTKNLKAIVVSRGNSGVALADKQKFATLAKAMYEKVTSTPGFSIHKWGTMGSNLSAQGRMSLGRLPIKNQTTNLWPGGNTFSEETIRSQPYFNLKRSPCWACRFVHCHSLEITSGPYAGYKGDEPDYELWTGFGPLIGNFSDWAGMAVLSNDADRLGLDGNEASWLTAWLMECYEKGVLTREALDGLELNWGSVEAARSLLKKVAFRKGVGNLLAEGVMRSAKRFGGEAKTLAVYTEKGNTPRMHDHRASWPMILDTVTSDRGRDSDAPQTISHAIQVGLPETVDLFTPDGAAMVLAKIKGRLSIPDSLVVCRFNGVGASLNDWAELVKAATGWAATGSELAQIALRIVNLYRIFNLRHGHSRNLESPSARYASAPIDGINMGKTFAPVWDEALDKYYELMGWDKKTGEPLPETLAALGL